MTRTAAVVSAPTDGKPLYLGFQSAEVTAPASGVEAYFHCLGEPAPHADALFQLLVKRRVLRGYIWGTSTFWSPNGRFLAADWTGVSSDTRLDRRLVLIDLIEWTYVDCGAFHLAQIDDEGLHGKDAGGNRASIRFVRQTDWNAA